MKKRLHTLHSIHRRKTGNSRLSVSLRVSRSMRRPAGGRGACTVSLHPPTALPRHPLGAPLALPWRSLGAPRRSLGAPSALPWRSPGAPWRSLALPWRSQGTLSSLPLSSLGVPLALPWRSLGATSPTFSLMIKPLALRARG